MAASSNTQRHLQDQMQRDLPRSWGQLGGHHIRDPDGDVFYAVEILVNCIEYHTKKTPTAVDISEDIEIQVRHVTGNASRGLISRWKGSYSSGPDGTRIIPRCVQRGKPEYFYSRITVEDPEYRGYRTAGAFPDEDIPRLKAIYGAQDHDE